MIKQIKTSIKIKASKQVIWDIITDFEKYPEWNPFIKSIIGKPKEGNRITILLESLTFNPKIIKNIEKFTLRWLEQFWFKGMVDGEHEFVLTDNKDGTVNLEQNEIFKGAFVRFLDKSIGENTKKGFNLMNKALKKRAEKLMEQHRIVEENYIYRQRILRNFENINNKFSKLS